MKKIKCSELGIKDCDYTARGETAGDVVTEMVEHLRSVHEMDMPDADVILAGEMSKDPLEVVDPGLALIVERLRENLNLVAPEGPQTPEPTIGRTPSI
jgi:predicted small metal-binding protein